MHPERPDNLGDAPRGGVGGEVDRHVTDRDPDIAPGGAAVRVGRRLFRVADHERRDMASSAPGSGAGSTNAPSFAIRRQADNWFGWTPYRAATALTVAPGRRVSATTRAFTSSGQRR